MGMAAKWPLRWTSTAVPRVEDPIRIVQLTERIAALSWKAQEQRESLRVLFQSLSDLTQAEIQYYYTQRCSARRLSRFCRAAAWLLGTIGVLVPVLAPVLPVAPASWLSWGYIAFALAGSALVADKTFAGSTAHQRYTRTQLQLEQLYTLFAIEWQTLVAALDTSPGADRLTAAILRAVDYCKALHQTLGAETAEWSATMDAVMEDLKNRTSGKAGRSE